MKIKEKIKNYLELIKFEHTIFALPFAISGMLLADNLNFPNLNTLIWVLLAMIGGRTAGMALNRVIDAEIDAKNPRTVNRAIPAGVIKKSSAIFLACVSFAVMIFAVFQLPLICRYLLPIAIAIIVLYSYTKRFTSLSHIAIGLVLGAAGAGGWLAVSQSLTFDVVLWASAIMFWVAGFDIIYSIQDAEFDKKNNLFSIPSKFGINKALKISKGFHILYVILLLTLGKLINVGLFYYIGCIFIASMLVYEHSLISEKDLSKLNQAFFITNGIVSVGFMLFIILDKWFKII